MNKLSKYLFYLFLALVLAGCERIIDEEESDSDLSPAVPKGFSVYSATDGEVIIRWDVSSENNISGYYIYRAVSDSVMPIQIATVNSRNYYYDDSLDYNKVYYYKICAVNNRQKTSDLTGYIAARPINQYSPAKPQNLAVNGRFWDGRAYFSLQWNSNLESDLAGYKIYRSEFADFDTSSATFIGISKTNQFSDTTKSFTLYKNYYYKVSAFDKGNLTSEASNTTNDVILELPEIIAPQNNASFTYLDQFSFRTISAVCDYKIIVSNNPFIGEIWSKQFTATPSTQPINVLFDYYYLTKGDYYWRIITISNDNGQPNSISPTFKFTIK